MVLRLNSKFIIRRHQNIIQKVHKAARLALASRPTNHHAARKYANENTVTLISLAGRKVEFIMQPAKSVGLSCQPFQKHKDLDI